MGKSSVGDPPTMVNRKAMSFSLVTEPELEYRLKQGDIRLYLVSPANFATPLITAQEQECLILLLQDLTVKEIANTLDIAINNVNKHLMSLRKKWQCHTNNGLVLKASKNGFTPDQ